MIYRLDVSSVASDEADCAALNIANMLGVDRPYFTDSSCVTVDDR